MGFLDGDLAEAIYKGFKGKLSTGIIRQFSAPTSGALDEYGDPVDLAATDTAIEGFAEAYSDFYRAQAGIPDTDLKVNIFAKSCPDITPGKDDLVKLTRAGIDTWYQLRKVAVDPAQAMFTCQAFVVPEPV